MPETQRSQTPRPLEAGPLVLLFAGLGAVVLVVLGPALGGPFLSDDIPYILDNPYVRTLSTANLVAILDPFGAPAFNTHNYAPLHLLSHALEWRIFGESVTGYHVANALLHAGVATLLAALLVVRGLPAPAAMLLAALFAVHPANVEATAWIYQLKTLGAAAFALGALLAHPRRPLLAVALFGAALGMKASAAAALAPAAVWTFLDHRTDGDWRRRRAWLVVWAALFAVYAVVQTEAYARSSGADQPLHPDFAVNARSIVAIAARYLVMAATSWGTSALHDPARALSWTDPWWVAGAVLLALLGARIVYTLKERREEAAWWLLAAAAYAPTSQIVPFLIPMADHYLYFPLLGLLGAVAFALREPLGKALARPRAALAAGCLLLVLGGAFAAKSHARARIWRSSVTLALDSASHYPNGLAAHLLRANRAGRQGDVDAAVLELRGALARGYDRFLEVDQSRNFAAVRHDPAFRELIRDIAGAWLDLSLTLEEPTQEELSMRAQAHLARGELDAAITAVEQALARGGPFDGPLRAQLAELRRAQRSSLPIPTSP